MYRWSLQGPGASFLSSLGILAVVGMGAYLLQTESTFTSGKFFAFLLYANMFYEPVRQLVSINNLIAAREKHQVSAFLRFLTHQMKLKTHKYPVDFPQRVENIEFRDVSFSYDDRNTIIDGLSFSMPEGSTTALVGATGSGKTTAANLLLRYYNLTKGQIKIGKENLQQN